MSTGDRVRSARKAKGLTQQELAAKAGIKQPTLSELENGESTSTAHIAKLAAALEVSPLWLETGRGPRRGLSAANTSTTELDDVMELMANFKNSTAAGRALILDAARSAEKIAGFAHASVDNQS